MGKLLNQLCIELGKVTGLEADQTSREVQLASAIRAALKISSLWAPTVDEDLEALRQMHETFKALVE